MKRVFALSALVVASVACGDDGGSTGPNPDAAIAGDAPITLIDAPTTVDMPAGATCTGALYDPCTADSQCMSGACRIMGGGGGGSVQIQVCTQACTTGGPACPDQGTTAVRCSNGMQLCRPDVANTCTR